MNFSKKYTHLILYGVVIISAVFMVGQFIIAQVYHVANSVAAGTFGSDIGETGNYVFPGDLGVTGDVTTNNIYLNSAGKWLIDETTGLIRKDLLPL